MKRVYVNLFLPAVMVGFAAIAIIAIVMLAKAAWQHGVDVAPEPESWEDTLIRETFDEYGIDEVSVGHEEYGPNMAVELRCAVYVKWYDGRAVCITDKVEDVK